MAMRRSTNQTFSANAVFIAHFILWILLSVQIIHALVPLVESPSFGISLFRTDRGLLLKVNDFPSHFNFAQTAWLRGTTVSAGASIYSAKNHLKVTSSVAGQQVSNALPFGYSPTMLWVLAPLVPFPSATAFLLFDVAGLFAIFWMTSPSRCRWGIGLLAFFSNLAGFCLALGQTALATGAGLAFVAGQPRSAGNGQNLREQLLRGVVLWALTAKPPIALSAAAVLIGLRQWRMLIVAGMLSIFSTLLIAPLLGSHWLADYLHLIGSYNRIDADPVFAFSFNPTSMASLRAILTVDIGLRDNLASHISAGVWLIALGYIVIMGLRSRLPAAALWSLSILSYLLFCPHVVATEELQVVIIFALCIPLTGKLRTQELFLLVILPLLVFVSPVSKYFWEMRLPLFLSQLFLFFFFAFSGERFALDSRRELLSSRQSSVSH
jgi:hypothetical protein